MRSQPKSNPLFYLALIILIGAIARVWFFWAGSIHTDETFTLNLLNHSLPYIVHYTLTTDYTPPLFYIIDWVSTYIFGLNIFAERLPSVIFGILLIPAVYTLGKEMRNQTLGLLSALAVSTIGSLWYYSQFGRPYILECLLFTIFCIYFIKIVRGDTHKQTWLYLFIMSVLLVWTQLYAVIPLVCIFGYLLIIKPHKTILWAFMVAVLSSPLLLLFKQVIDTRSAVQYSEIMLSAQQLTYITPLDYFGYLFVFWVPLVIYSAFINRQKSEVTVPVISFIISFIVMLVISSVTPMFAHYILLVVPSLIVIGLLPVINFIESTLYTVKQKWMIAAPFIVYYFGILIFSFWSGVYIIKGTINI